MSIPIVQLIIPFPTNKDSQHILIPPTINQWRLQNLSQTLHNVARRKLHVHDICAQKKLEILKGEVMMLGRILRKFPSRSLEDRQDQTTNNGSYNYESKWSTPTYTQIKFHGLCTKSHS